MSATRCQPISCLITSLMMLNATVRRRRNHDDDDDNDVWWFIARDDTVTLVALTACRARGCPPLLRVIIDLPRLTYP